MSDCSFCGELAEESLSIRHRQCGHLTHADCIPAGTKPNFKQCGACTGDYQKPSSSGGVDSVGKGGGTKKISAEPRPIDGKDYLLHPGKKTSPHLLSAVTSYLPLVGKKTPETVENSKNPLFLLQNGVPLPTIIKRNELGLQHFAQAGVKLTDFLDCGYTWDDLKMFEDLSRKGTKRALQALTIGLGATANHFRDYPDAFPFEQVKADTKLQTKDLCVHFGLTFPDDGPLECLGDQNWNASDCVALGVTIDDLSDFGLYYLQQYKDLMRGVSKKDMARSEKALGTTIEHLQGLVDLEQIQRDEEEQLMAAAVEREQQQQQQQKTLLLERQKQQQQQQQKRFEPAPVEMEEEIPTVAAAERQQYQIPVRHQEERRKLFEERSAFRAARHGAVLK